MSAQDILRNAHVVRVRELQATVDRLKAENAALRDELESLKHHVDLALLVAQDLADGDGLEIWDGWNLILGTGRQARDRKQLVAQAQAAGRRIWIVFDGPDERVRTEGLVRVSYTGGHGPHRADAFICDFVRMAAYRGLAQRIVVRTNDKDFRKTIRRLGAALDSRQLDKGKHSL